MWLMTQYGFFSVVRDSVRDHEDSESYLVCARVRNDLENFRRLAQIENEIADSQDADYRYRLTITAEELGRAMDAFALTVDYESFVERVSELPDQRQKKSAYLHIRALMRDVAEPSAEDVQREDDPRFWPEDDGEIEAMFQEAVACGQSGDHERALEILDEIIAQAPEAPVPHWLRGVHLGSLGRHEEAVWAFKAGLDIEPSDPHALFNMALACTRTGRYDAARLSLTRALDAESDFADALLVLGFVYAREQGIETPQTLDEWLSTHEEGVVDLQDAETHFLLALAYLAQDDLRAAQEEWEELRDMDGELAAALEPWLLGELSVQSEVASPPDEWESENDDLRAALERAARWAARGDAVPAEATEMVYRAVMDGWLLVPLNEEPDEREAGTSLALRSGPLDGLNGEIGLVAFTDEAAMEPFFNGMAEHNVVLQGADLCRALAQMAGKWTDSGHAPMALVLNPAGPHPYALSLPSLVFLATGGVPLDTEHAVIGEGTTVEIRLPEDGETGADEHLMDAIREAIAASAAETGAREVWWFEVRFGAGDLHLGLGVAPGDTEIVDAVGRAVNAAWSEHAPSLAVYDVIGMEGDMAIRIRNSGALLWKAAE